jgi:hypothetical protein
MTRRARRGVLPLPPTGNKSVLQAETQRDGQVQVQVQVQAQAQEQAPPQVLQEQTQEQAPAQPRPLKRTRLTVMI